MHQLTFTMYEPVTIKERLQRLAEKPFKIPTQKAIGPRLRQATWDALHGQPKPLDIGLFDEVARNQLPLF
jgi:hypothetical protein